MTGWRDADRGRYDRDGPVLDSGPDFPLRPQGRRGQGEVGDFRALAETHPGLSPGQACMGISVVKGNLGGEFLFFAAALCADALVSPMD